MIAKKGETGVEAYVNGRADLVGSTITAHLVGHGIDITISQTAVAGKGDKELITLMLNFDNIGIDVGKIYRLEIRADGSDLKAKDYVKVID